MRRLVRVSALASAGVLAMTLLTACGGGEEAAQGSNGEIKIALSAGLDLLDPTRTANGPDLAVMTQIYETLLDLDPKTQELTPKLAKSYELINPTTWQFKLRDDVKFSNGEPFTAEAVKYSIERILDPKTGSTSSSQIATIESVDIVDDYTVNLVTSAPDPVLPRRMQPIGGSGRVFIVPPKYFAENSNEVVSDKPVGTGPFKLDQWNKGQSVVLVQNSDYWGEKPQVKKATYSFITEASTRVNALLSGEVDIIQRVPVEDVERVQKADKVHVESSPDGLVHTILLDTRKAPFNNPKVREAFVKAINVQGFVKQLLKGNGRVLGVPMGPNVKQYDNSIKPYQYDPAAAKQLLIDAGYPNGVDLATKTSDGRYVADKQIYDVINKQLDDAGFNIKPQVVEWGRLISQMQEGSAGPFFIIGWDFGEGDASKMNSFLLSSSAISMARVPEYDALAKKAGTTTDEAENMELWAQAQQVIYDSYAVGAVWQADAIWGESDSIEWKPAFGENIILTEIAVK